MKLMDQLTNANIKQEAVFREDGQQQQNKSKDLSSRHDSTLSNVCVKQEFNQKENDLINSEQQIDKRGQCPVRLSCTKVKKEEEIEREIMFDGDEWDCLECRVEREIKIEFNQNNATGNQTRVNLPGPSNVIKSASSQCKRVKKEEEHDEEWDEDCDCDQCRSMRLKAIPLELTNATENREDDGFDGDETEIEEGNDLEENGGDFAGDGQASAEHNEDGDESDEEADPCVQGDSNDQIDYENDDETEIDDEEYEMDVDGEELNDDEETEVDEQYDRESEAQSARKFPSQKVAGRKPRKVSKHICEYCGKTFPDKSHFKIHIRKHTGEKPFKCTWKGCHKEFSLKHNMKAHYTTHTGKKPFKCSWNGCESSFLTKKLLDGHYNIHTGNKPFKCTWKYCNREFSFKSNMKAHYKTHTGEKLHKCTWKGCGKAFGRQNLLSVHTKQHKEEKSFKCTWKDCDEAYILKKQLDKHYMREHTKEFPYTCQHCKKGFILACYLTIHLQTHAAEKRFKCSWKGCGLTFSRKLGMQIHYRKHTGEKPFKCPWEGCNTTTSDPSYIRKHYRIIHKS